MTAESWLGLRGQRNVAPDTNMTLHVTLCLCALLAALLIYRYDLVEREPWPYLAAIGAIGMLTMWRAAIRAPGGADAS